MAVNELSLFDFFFAPLGFLKNDTVEGRTTRSSTVEKTVHASPSNPSFLLFLNHHGGRRRRLLFEDGGSKCHVVGGKIEILALVSVAAAVDFVVMLVAIVKTHFLRIRNREPIFRSK